MRDGVINRRTALRSAAMFSMAALAACSNDDGPTAKPQPEGDGTVETTLVSVPDGQLTDLTGQDIVEIDVIDNAYEPRWVLVSPGTEVRWTNKGRNHHNIVVPDELFPGVEQEQFPEGSTHAVTFETAGEYPYFCSLHGTLKNGQNGLIRVVD